MTRFIFYIILVVFVGCNIKQVTNDKTILTDQTPTYQLMVQETGTKINDKGDIQCQFYKKTMETSDSLAYYGLHLTEVIALLCKTPEKNILLKNQEFKNPFINVYYHQSDKKSGINKQAILVKLENQFHFKIKADSTLATVYNLVVADYPRLQQCRLAYSSSNSIQVAGDGLSITSQHISISSLAKTLNQQLAQHITTTISDTGQYDFKLKLSPFSKLQNDLIRQYGLTLEEKQLFIPIFYVNPQ